jgi:hypothetical protein
MSSTRYISEGMRRNSGENQEEDQWKRNWPFKDLREAESEEMDATTELAHGGRGPAG